MNPPKYIFVVASPHFIKETIHSLRLTPIWRITAHATEPGSSFQQIFIHSLIQINASWKIVLTTGIRIHELSDMSLLPLVFSKHLKMSHLKLISKNLWRSGHDGVLGAFWRDVHERLLVLPDRSRRSRLLRRLVRGRGRCQRRTG